MDSPRLWIDTAQDLIKLCREAEQPVWVDQAVREIIRKHPDCGIPETALADMVRKLVVRQRGSMAG